ncbi:unnamed protein product [Dicrocoelium dendriticum]|nr:unnamed protein product [Dicrocoelium dendriticum]
MYLYDHDTIDIDDQPSKPAAIGVRLITTATQIQRKNPCSLLRERTKTATLDVTILIECRSDVIGLPESLFTHPLYTAKERLSAFISGPTSMELCEELLKRMGDKFFAIYKSCLLEQRGISKAPEQNIVLYGLAAREPFHAVDEPFYNNFHSLLVNNLNEAHSTCLYNGYIITQPTEIT